MRAQKRKKMTAVAHFGGKCQVCGYSRCIDALEFHHLDKSEKEESPTYVIMRWSWSRALVELEKCVMLCSNCHREAHHAKDFNVDLRSLVKPWITVECLHCHEQFKTKVYDRKYCSVSCNQLACRKVTRPSKSELENLIRQQIPWVQLGKKFGVSDNAVRKWAKNYGLLNGVVPIAANSVDS